MSTDIKSNEKLPKDAFSTGYAVLAVRSERTIWRRIRVRILNFFTMPWARIVWEDEEKSD